MRCSRGAYGLSSMQKSKMEHKCQLLSREVSIVNNAQVALKKQSEKQLELIVKLQDQNKLVSDHLVRFVSCTYTVIQNLMMNYFQATCEKELALKATSLSAEQLRVSETVQQLNALKTEVDQSKQKCDSLATLVRSKAELVDTESSSKRKLEDQLSSLRHKVELLTREGGDADLRDQLDGYKILLKCSACNNRFKSHCLLKCMHVFWYVFCICWLLMNVGCSFVVMGINSKECLDDRFNSRQRKCPSCSLAFGREDIRQVFL